MKKLLTYRKHPRIGTRKLGPDLRDNGIAAMIEDNENLYKETTISGTEVKAAGGKAKTPATADKLIHYSSANLPPTNRASFLRVFP